jgi:hypothetical protein
MDLVHVQRRGAGFVEAAIRIVVAIEPQMYREVLAFHIRKERPAVEVVLASPQSLRGEVEQARPHLIFAAEVPSELKEMDALFWVELSPEDGLVATIRVNGYSDTIHDVSLQDLLAVVDKTQEELLAHDDE